MADTTFTVKFKEETVDKKANNADRDLSRLITAASNDNNKALADSLEGLRKEVSSLSATLKATLNAGDLISAMEGVTSSVKSLGNIKSIISSAKESGASPATVTYLENILKRFNEPVKEVASNISIDSGDLSKQIASALKNSGGGQSDLKPAVSRLEAVAARVEDINTDSRSIIGKLVNSLKSNLTKIVEGFKVEADVAVDIKPAKKQLKELGKDVDLIQSKISDINNTSISFKAEDEPLIVVHDSLVELLKLMKSNQVLGVDVTGAGEVEKLIKQVRTAIGTFDEFKATLGSYVKTVDAARRPLLLKAKDEADRVMDKPVSYRGSNQNREEKHTFVTSSLAKRAPEGPDRKSADSPVGTYIQFLNKVIEQGLVPKSDKVVSKDRSTVTAENALKALKDAEASLGRIDEIFSAISASAQQQVASKVAPVREVVRPQKSVYTPLASVTPASVKTQNKVEASKINTEAAKTSLSALRSMRDTMRNFAQYESPKTKDYLEPGRDYLANADKADAMHTSVLSVTKGLADSLQKLQDAVYNSVKKIEENNTGWQVVGRKPSEAFNLKGNQWAMNIADASAIKRAQGLDPKAIASVEDLLPKYRNTLSQQAFGPSGQFDVTGDLDKARKDMAKWFSEVYDPKTMLTGQFKRGIGPTFANQLEAKKAQGTSIDTDKLLELFKSKTTQELLNIYGETVGAGTINSKLAESKVVRTVAFPAARLTREGTTVIDTQHGRQRAVSQYATYKTGFEEAFDKIMEKYNAVPSGVSSNAAYLKDLAATTRKASTLGPNVQRDETTSRKMLVELAQVNAPIGEPIKDLTEVVSLYKKAVVPISIEKQRVSGGAVNAKDEESRINTFIDNLQSANVSVKDFMKGMTDIGVSATAVLSSMDSIDFSNFYDMANRTIVGKLDKIQTNPRTAESAIKSFERSFTQLGGLMPIVEGNAPRRGLHQTSVVNTIAHTSQAFDFEKHLEPGSKERFDFEKEAPADFKLDTDSQKKFIKFLNKRNRELFYEAEELINRSGDVSNFSKADAERLSKLRVGFNKGLSTLGLPDSIAGSVVNTRTNTMSGAGEGAAFEGADELNKLNAKILSMYSGDLKALAPFAEFQQIGRNISNVTSAKTLSGKDFPDIAGRAPELPTLVSAQEKNVIEAGRYGDSGYGFNVLAELRHTAGTFEDQILVSGELAKAVTSSAKKLIRPSADITTGIGGMTAHTLKGEVSDADIEQVSKEIQQRFGISEKYQGRADKAFMKDVKNELTTNRGETTEVQTARMAELFMNHFGRKFTTRYGSKGVSITPTGDQTVASLLEKFGDKDFKIGLAEGKTSGAALGVAKMPKSAGQMLVDLFGDTTLSGKTDLQDTLVKSGNKFILDIFKNSQEGLVTEEEANKNKEVFKKVSSVLGDVTKDFSSIRGAHEAKFGKEAGYTLKPIDIRISSYGAGKRGLQTEALEMITSNVAGTAKGGETAVADKLDFSKLTAGKHKKGSLSEAASKVGYIGAAETESDIEKAVKEAYGSESPEFLKALMDLEKDSSFYVDVIDELGKRRKSLVGTKFVQIIEETKGTDEWSKGAIASGQKGLKLNIPAYAAYNTIFGQDSAMMKQINSSFDEKQAEALDAINTFLVEKKADFRKNVLDNLEEVSLKSIKAFEGNIGTFTGEGPNSLKGTIFDVDDPTKLGKAFKVRIPSTQPGKEAGKAEEAPTELYIPKPISRTTFEDKLVPGGRGISSSSRDLQNIINRAQELQAYLDKDLDLLSESDKYYISQKGAPAALHKKINQAVELPINTVEEKTYKVQELQNIAEGLVNAISNSASEEVGSLNKKARPPIMGLEGFDINKEGLSQKDYADALKANLGAIKSLDLGPLTAFVRNLKTFAVGSPYKTGSMSETMSSPEKRFQFTKDIAAGTNLDLFEFQGSNYQKRIAEKRQGLEASKSKYSTGLEQSLVGKSGALAEQYFTKKVPAVLGRAVQATVDRTEELQSFSDTLKGFGGFDTTVTEIEKILAEHKANLEGSKRTGLPILKQHELGIPSKLAEKLPVEFTKMGESESTKGTLAELLKYKVKLEKSAEGRGAEDQKAISDYIESELAPYIESVRFPFTGTSSVQPYKAKLLPTKPGLNEDALMVPGMPEMNFKAFDSVIKTVQDKIESLVAKRESLTAIKEGGLALPGTEAELIATTEQINKLNKALSDVTPKYIAHAQKLDFDGDQIEIHSAATSQARGDIKKHFELLTNDVDSTAAKFRTTFAYKANQPAQGDLPLAFMSKAFSKKFSPDMGFDFLKKPFLTQDMSFLSTADQLKIAGTKKSIVSGGAQSDISALDEILKSAYSYAGASDQYSSNSIKSMTDLGSAADKAAENINSLKDVSQKGLITGYVKEMVSNMRIDDAIEAQLFKVHTGPDVEAISRLMRIFESSLGFGAKGEIGTAASKGLGQDFVARERHTQMNELYRFAVQKGMDVKHAGEQPVSGEITKLLLSGKDSGGFETLLSNVKNKKNYEDLSDFAKTNEKALREKFGAFSIKELEAFGKELNIAPASDRSELIDALVKKLGFEGFLTDLRNDLLTKAIAGMSDPKEIKKTLSKNLSATSIMEKQSPLYPYRTFAAGDKVGGDKNEQLIAALEGAKTSSGAGAYDEMVKSAENNLEALAKSFNEEFIDKLKLSTGEIKLFDEGTFSKLRSISSDLGKAEAMLGLAPFTEAKRSEVLAAPAAVKARSSMAARTDMSQEEIEKVLAAVDEFALLQERLSRAKLVAPKSTTISSEKTDTDIKKETENQAKAHEVITEAIPALPSSVFTRPTPKVSTQNKEESSYLQSLVDYVGSMEGGSINPPAPPAGGAKDVLNPEQGGVLRVILAGIATTDTLRVAVVSSAVKFISQNPSMQMKDEGTFDAARMNPERIASQMASDAKQTNIQGSSSIEPYPGNTTSSQLKNIELLRSAAKLVARSKGQYSDELFKDLPDTIKEIIEGAKQGEKTGGRLFEEIANIQAMEYKKPEEQKTVSGAKVQQIWVLYRDAQLQYLIDKAKEAEQNWKEIESTSNDYNKISIAEENFRQSVSRIQEQIKKQAGSRSDMFTANRLWHHPDIAKAAGTFLNANDIRTKTMSDFYGGQSPVDDKLIKVTTKLTDDLYGKSRDKMMAPMDKARYAIKELTSMDEEAIKLMEDGKLLERMGPQIAEAWNFKEGAQSISRLREALEQFRQYNVSDSPLSVERKNLDSTIKMLKDAENKLSYMDISRATDKKGGGAWGETGVIPVPKWLDATTQEAMNKRNISKVQQYMSTPQEKGGAQIGETYNYVEKVFDQSGNAVKNIRHSFSKYKEVIDATGETIGKFSVRQSDLNKAISGATGGLGGAIKRAVLWGSASAIVYGGFSKLKEAVSTLAEIETSVASLRMVMAPLSTDFGEMQQDAVNFAKEYGVPINKVLDGMKVFAQQGLTQAEVIDRARTSTLAANVTTLSAKDATEALTAATKVFNVEGSQSMSLLDSWAEVESRTAITAGDLADAIKKSASAAKSAGVTFDELNGIVSAIGSTTRQSGKEVGTSIRFIMSRLSTEKGPGALGKLGIPVISNEGDLRSGYDILHDLAGKWEELNNSQKMTIAQALGGTRQYNSVLVLMDNWKEALDATRFSMNSKGAAERMNMELMKTYEKQVEQTRAAIVELQLSVGKVAFPIFKAGLQATKVITEAITGIPGPIKAASVAALALFTYLSKGAKIIDSIADFFSSGAPVAGDFFSSIKDELRMGAFEVLGAGESTSHTQGLKTINVGAKQGVEQGIQLSDFHSSIGKAAFLLVSAGKTFNDYLGGAVKGAGKVGEVGGRGMKSVGNFLSLISAATIGKPLAGEKLRGKDLNYEDLSARAAGVGVSYKGVADAIKMGGLKSATFKTLGGVAALSTEVAGLGTTAAGIFVENFSKKLGAGGDLFKEWAKNNAGIVEAIAPMLLSVSLAVPAVKALGDQFIETTKSSQDFEKAMYGLRLENETALSATRNNASSYKKLQAAFNKVKDLEKPEVANERKRLGTYKSPILETADIAKEATTWTNNLALSNLELVAGYDNLGNAVLKTSKNFDALFKAAERSKVKELASTTSKIAAKHIESLTQSEGPEKWKYELKALTKEVPVFGDLLSNQIKVSPAKGLKEATKQLNVLIAKKGAAPLSTIYDSDIKTAQAALGKIREGFNETYSDFKKSLSNIPTEGLNKDEISKILGAKELQAGYKLMLDVEPKLKIGAKNSSWQDVLGSEVMRRVFPSAGSLLDVSKDLTKANIESAGLAKREGKVLSGDVVTFMDDVAEKYNIAGQQAIVSLKETSDGVFDWVATYFNTKTLKVEERSFDGDLKKFVDSVLPVKAIEKDLSDRIDSLNEFTAGAGAGLRGVNAKEFKRDFNLGERFFSDVATTTLIQGSKGFSTTSGFGESPFQKGWADDFKKYYAKPAEEYANMLEDLKKMELEGIDPTTVSMSTELYDSLVALQSVLQNNQVVMQYRAVFADLTKTMEANTRASEENMAVEESRLRLTRETVGLLKGKNASLANIDFGVKSKANATAQQRLLAFNPKFEEGAKKLSSLELKRTGIAENIYAGDRAKVALESIKRVSAGFGTTLAPEDLKKYTETVAKTGDLGVAELKVDTSKTADNTEATVDRLDKLIENFNKQGDVEDMSKSITDAISLFSLSPLNISDSSKMGEALDRIANARNEAIKSGDSETLIKANKALDLVSNKLIEKVGLEKAGKIVDRGLFTQGAFNSKELYQRAFGEVDIKTFLSELKNSYPDETKLFGLIKSGGTPELDKAIQELTDLQSKNIENASQNSVFNSKNLAGASAGMAVYGIFNRDYTNKKIDAIDAKITSIKEEATQAGATTAITTPEGVTSIKPSGKYAEEIAKLEERRSEEVKRSKLFGTIQAAAGGTAAATMFARNMGMDESWVKKIGATGGALGIYGAGKLQTGMTGEDLPDSFKKYGEELKSFMATMKEDGIFSSIKKGFAYKGFKNASADFVKNVTEEALGVGKPDQEKPKRYWADYGKPGTEKMDEFSSKVSDTILKAAEDPAGALETLKALFEKYIGSLDSNTEATNRNTEAREGDSQTGTNQGGPAAAFGGVIQKFAKGGVVKQAVPGSGDVQPALLTAGERVLPKKLASGGQAGTDRAIDETPSIDPSVRSEGKLGRYLAAGSLFSAGSLYAMRGHKPEIDQAGRSIPFNLKDTAFNLKGKGADYIKNFSITEKVKGMDKTLFANPVPRVKDAYDAIKTLKNVKGAPAKTALKVAGKAGLKSAWLLGTALTTGFAISRLLKGDLLGAGLEAVSGLLSGSGLGIGASVGIQGYLGYRDMSKLDKIGIQKSLKLNKLNALESGLPRAVSQIAGGGFVPGYALGGNIPGYGAGSFIANSLFNTIDATDFLIRGLYGTAKLPISAIKYGLKGAKYVGMGAKAAYPSVRDVSKKVYASTLASSSRVGKAYGAVKSKAEKELIKRMGPKYWRMRSDIAEFKYKHKPTAAVTSALGLAGAGVYYANKEEDPYTEKHVALGGFIPKYGLANGGYTFKGPGTGTSDSIPLMLPTGGFVVPSKYADKARDYVEGLPVEAQGNAGGNLTPARVSNGEYFIPPELAGTIGKEDLEKLRHGQIKNMAYGGVVRKYADGGEVSNTPIDPTAGVDYNRVAQITASTVAAALARYATEKDQQKVRTADLEKGAVSESKLIYDVATMNPKAVGEVYDKLKTTMLSPVGGKKADTEEVSKVLDTNKELERTSADVKIEQDSLNKSYEDTTTDVAKLKQELAELEIAEQFEMEIEAINRSIQDANFADNFKKSLKVGKGIYAGLGEARPLDLGTRTKLGLDPTQTYQLQQERILNKSTFNKFLDFIKSPKGTITGAVGAKMAQLNPSNWVNRRFDKMGINSYEKYNDLEQKKQYIQAGIDTALAKRAEAKAEGHSKQVVGYDETLNDLKKQLEEAASAQEDYAVAVEAGIRATSRIIDTIQGITEYAKTIVAQRTESQYSISNLGFNGKLKGAISNLNLVPVNESQLSSEQFMSKEASGTGISALIQSYSDKQSKYDQDLSKLQELQSKRMEAEAEFTLASTGNLRRSSAKQSIAENLDELKKEEELQRKKLEIAGKSLEADSKIIQGFKSITDALQQFKNELMSVKVANLIESSGGRSVGEVKNRLFGGSSPYAPQALTAEQIYRAARSGSVLTPGKSNAWDVQRAQAFEEMSSSTGQAREDAYLKISRIPQEQYLEEEQRKYTQNAERTTRTISPLETWRDQITKALIDNPIFNEKPEVRSKYEDELSKINSTIESLYQSQAENPEGTSVDIGTIESLVSASSQRLRGLLPAGQEPMFDISRKSYEELKLHTSLLATIAQEFGTNLEDLAKQLDPSSRGLEMFGLGTHSANTGDIVSAAQIGAQKHGGPLFSSIKGPGTGTSDSITTVVPHGSYVVQSKYANKAKNYISGLKDGGVPVRVSNGELLITPEGVHALGGVSGAASLNRGIIPKYAAGGPTPYVQSVRRKDQTVTEWSQEEDRRIAEWKKANGLDLDGTPVKKPGFYDKIKSMISDTTMAQVISATGDSDKARALKELDQYAEGGAVYASLERREGQSVDDWLKEDDARRAAFDAEQAAVAAKKAAETKSSSGLFGKLKSMMSSTKTSQVISATGDSDKARALKELDQYAEGGYTKVLQDPRIFGNAVENMDEEYLRSITNSYQNYNDKISSINATKKDLSFMGLRRRDILKISGGYPAYFNVDSHRIGLNNKIASASRDTKGDGKPLYSNYGQPSAAKATMSRMVDAGITTADQIYTQRTSKILGNLNNRESVIAEFEKQASGNKTISTWGKKLGIFSQIDWATATPEQKTQAADAFLENKAEYEKRVSAHNDTSLDMADRISAMTQAKVISGIGMGSIARQAASDMSFVDKLTAGRFESIPAEVVYSIFGKKQGAVEKALKSGELKALPNGKYLASYRLMSNLRGAGPSVFAGQDQLNNGSLPVKHNGGDILKTGSYFLQAGEIVLPRSFKEGGLAESNKLGTASSLNKSTIEIKGLDEAVSRIEKAFASVKDVKVGLDDNASVKVDKDSFVKVDPTAIVKVDPDYTVKVDTNAVVKVDPNYFVKVDPGAVVKVDTSTPIVAEIDASKIADVIGNKLASLNLGTNSVGADSRDKLADVIDKIDSRVSDLKTQHLSDIELVKSSISELQTTSASSYDEELVLKVDTLSAGLDDLSKKKDQFTKSVEDKFAKVDNSVNRMLTLANSLWSRLNLK